MKPDLQDRLYKDFPEEFREKDLPEQQTCMCWGCDCGDGWEPILRRMLEKLKGKGCTLQQVKEKFGTLRVYWSAKADIPKEDWDFISKVVGDAEDESAKTCEFCGKPGKQRPGGWIRTLCDECDTETGREAQRKKQLDQVMKRKKDLEDATK